MCIRDRNIINHYTYTFLGDGCMMEGISHEACSLAGNWGLSKLIAFYDDNGISIDGEVKGWFAANTPERFHAYGWQVIRSVNGHEDVYKRQGEFTPWEDIPADTDLMFYEGLHGAAVTDKANVAQQADLLVGVVPTINLEWIQKLLRDKTARGYSTEAVVDTVLRRMPDYVNYILSLIHI